MRFRARALGDAGVSVMVGTIALAAITIVASIALYAMIDPPEELTDTPNRAFRSSLRMNGHGDQFIQITNVHGGPLLAPATSEESFAAIRFVVTSPSGATTLVNLLPDAVRDVPIGGSFYLFENPAGGANLSTRATDVDDPSTANGLSPGIWTIHVTEWTHGRIVLEERYSVQ